MGCTVIGVGERYQELLQVAKKQIELADHMLYVTYPLVQEAKFLLAIANHVISAARSAMQALLEFELLYKRLEQYNKTFLSEVEIYQKKIAPRYNLDGKYYKLLQRLMEVQKYDAESIFRFKKGEKYILSTAEYSMSAIDIDTVKKYSNLTKKFVQDIADAITKQNVQPNRR
jgi:hypothetical protein